MELTRILVSRLRAYLGNRRGEKRFSVRLPCRVTPSDRRVKTNGSAQRAWLDGHTADLSHSGLGLHLRAIRIGEHYLVGEKRRLKVIVELPNGPVEMEVSPVRYESLEEDETSHGYVIGVRIIAMSDQDRASYEDFIHQLLNGVPPD